MFIPVHSDVVRHNSFMYIEHFGTPGNHYKMQRTTFCWCVRFIQAFFEKLFFSLRAL